MKYLDEYRDAGVARALIDRIAREVRGNWVLMEICGGQTHTIMRYGLDQLLSRNIQLVHGPGCPVCATPLESIEKAMQLASRSEVILASYGDMLRVPGLQADLLQVKASGGDVRIIYSPADALKIARDNPNRKVVLFAVGFETNCTGPRSGNCASTWRRYEEFLGACLAPAGPTRDPRPGDLS
jgi:hydrogenase expression/formation protein HypD